MSSKGSIDGHLYFFLSCMAISFKNVITRMYSGRVGDIVLRNYGGKSVMAKRPDCSKVVKSPAQLENQKKFREGGQNIARRLRMIRNGLSITAKRKRRLSIRMSIMQRCLIV
jgi:hypothetical protein